jgi:hypothetical protein
MVSSANYNVRITQGGGSSIGATVPVKFQGKKPEQEQKPIVVQDAKIKFRKIREQDKYMVQGEWSEDYVVVKEIEASTKELEKNAELMSRYRLITFKMPTKRIQRYLKNCYKIDSIVAPQRYKGAGTKAIQSVLDRSLADRDTQGRLVVYAEITDGQTSPAGFFYKLGFRFVDKSMNEIMENWLRKNIETEAPKITGMMYLPKGNINKLMMYNKNLL